MRLTKHDKKHSNTFFLNPVAIHSNAKFDEATWDFEIRDRTDVAHFPKF